MGKSTKKKNKKVTAPKANIQELSISRDGGQIAEAPERMDNIVFSSPK